VLLLAAALLFATPGRDASAGHPPPRPSPGGRSGAEAESLRILFTAETRGNLAPCACPSRPLGGLARRVAFLHSYRDRPGVLCLDVGGFLPQGEVRLPDSPEVAREYVELLLDGMDTAGVRASALDFGERRFLDGITPEAMGRSGTRLLEADPPGPAFVFAAHGRRIAILALEETSEDALVRDAGAAARARCDLLVVLARADAFTGRRLARLARPDLVLLSRGARPEGLLMEGSVPLVGCGIEGREVGEVVLVLERDSHRARVADWRLHAMDATQPEHPELERRVRRLLARGLASGIASARE